MAKGIRLTDEEISKARKILARLPQYDGKKSAKEACELLEVDFKKARKKGYGYQAISDILKKEGIIIPAYLVKKYLAMPGQDDGEMVVEPVGEMPVEMVDEVTDKMEVKAEKTEGAMVDTMPDKMTEITPAENSVELGKPLVKKGKFVVLPDTPDGEL